ncbi:MAG: transglycosylase SLT domain-containing protein [bacterium]|nr:MAG: transglycosylase SLT domain-containing protein [bacterium]
MRTLSVFLISFMLLLPAAALGDIYRYVDENGVIVFTDNPTHLGYELHVRERGSFRLASASGYYPYRDLVIEACSIYSMDEALIRAVMEVESDYNRFAVSSAGARGLMQLMPETALQLGVKNIWDPRQNIHAGTAYLKRFISRFSGNMELALAAYNAGPNAVIQHGQIPPYPQTRNYVRKVIQLYRGYSGFRN